jgi:hypothetical protein
MTDSRTVYFGWERSLVSRQWNPVIWMNNPAGIKPSGGKEEERERSPTIIKHELNYSQPLDRATMERLIELNPKPDSRPKEETNDGIVFSSSG